MQSLEILPCLVLMTPTENCVIVSFSDFEFVMSIRTHASEDFLAVSNYRKVE